MKPDYGQFVPELPDIMKSLEKFYMVTQVDSEGSIIYTNKNLETSKWTPRRVLGQLCQCSHKLLKVNVRHMPSE